MYIPRTGTALLLFSHISMTISIRHIRKYTNRGVVVVWPYFPIILCTESCTVALHKQNVRSTGHLQAILCSFWVQPIKPALSSHGISPSSLEAKRGRSEVKKLSCYPAMAIAAAWSACRHKIDHCPIEQSQAKPGLPRSIAVYVHLREMSCSIADKINSCSVLSAKCIKRKQI